MSTERKVDIFAALVLVLSLIGLILLAALDFAAFYLPSYGTRFSCLSCEYSTDVDLAAQVIILVLLIIQIIIALNDLLPNKFIKKPLEKYGMFLAVATVLFAIIGITSFGVEYGEYEWWAAEGFWGSTIAGLLNTILFFLKYKNK